MKNHPTTRERYVTCQPGGGGGGGTECCHGVSEATVREWHQNGAGGWRKTTQLHGKGT